MIVCHCAVVTDNDVASAIDDGASTLAQLCLATSAGRRCGGCIFTLKALLCQHEDAIPAAASGSAPAWEEAHEAS